MQKIAVGFDLGTTISTVSVADASGNVRSIKGSAAHHLIPSAVYFGEDVVIGEAAMDQGMLDAGGLAEGFKRDIGKPHFHREVRFCQVPPEILTGFLLDHLAEMVRSEVGEFQQAVITVPAYFDEKKRTATQQAAHLAGIEVLDIINEPTAAAIAVGFEQFVRDPSGDRPRKILIYDLGGGTFDVTVLEFHNRTFRAIATDGDIYLGGRDFDERIANIIAEEFKARHGIDPRTSAADMQQLWRLARDAKHELTTRDVYSVSFQHAGLMVGFQLTRDRFEEAIEPLVERSLSTTRDVMYESNLRWEDLDEFLLVGGSSRIPVIAEKAAELFGRSPRLVDNPDELVSQGAALYAASKIDSSFLDANAQFDVVNVNAHSLGIQGVEVETGQKVNKILIPRNTSLPTSKSRAFVTNRDSQKSVKVRLLEGESENPEFCTVLGDCVVRVDPPMPKGSEVRVTCNYASNGTISVAAKIGQSKASAHVEIRRDGHSTLEPLRAWRARLTTGDEDLRSSTLILARPHPSVPEGNHVSNESDTATIVKRLDVIYGFVGNLAIDDTPPVNVIQTHRLVSSLVRETETLKQLVQHLEKLHQRTGQFQSRLELAGHLAQAKMAWETSIRLLEHSRVVLGRECVHSHVVPSPASRYLEEARHLQSQLEQLAG